MLVYVFFLTSFCSLVRLVICAPSSELDLLAAAASNEPCSLTYLTESLQISSSQEVILKSLAESVVFEQQLKALQHRARNNVNYLALLFRLLEIIPENDFSENGLIYNAARDFAKISSWRDGFDGLFDYRKLTYNKVKALGIASADWLNIPLFERLVQSRFLNLNDTFHHEGLVGNAVVFVHGYIEFLKLSLCYGLDLHSTVIVKNREMPTIEFLKLHANPEIVDFSQQWLGLDQAEPVKKRPSKSSSSEAKRQKRVKFVPLSSISPPSDDVEQHEWEIIGQPMPGDSSQAEIDWNQLRRFKPNAPGYLTQERYITLLRNRLSEEGPVRMAAFLSEYPVFLKRDDFFQMVRDVLKDDLAKIATVYIGNIKTTIKLLPELRAKFGNDELYIDFLRELLKYCGNRVDVIAYYTKMVASESAEFFASHDYSSLPVNILVEMVYHAVQNDAFALVNKLFAFNRVVFEVNIMAKGRCLNKLYSRVRSAAMLKKLLQLGVPPTSILENGCPFVFYFLMNRDSEYVAVLKESDVITEALVTESFNYCLEHFPGHAVIQKLTDILNEKSTLK